MQDQEKDKEKRTHDENVLHLSYVKYNSSG